MNKPSIDDRILQLAPVPEQLDQTWANEALARILADETPVRSRWVARHRTAAVAAAGVLTLTAGVGVATAAGGLDPIGAVKETLLGFAEEPNTTGNDVGTIHDPQLVAQFELNNGELFAVWFATTSEGNVCDAYSDPAWDGVGSPPITEYGCSLQVIDSSNPDKTIQLERPDQLGGFFKDDADNPILYGVSPFSGTAEVQVRGTDVDMVLPVRADSLGYGTALPAGTDAKSLELTFLGSDGDTLGRKTVVAPVG